MLIDRIRARTVALGRTSDLHPTGATGGRIVPNIQVYNSVSAGLEHTPASRVNSGRVRIAVSPLTRATLIPIPIPTYAPRRTPPLTRGEDATPTWRSGQLGGVGPDRQQCFDVAERPGVVVNSQCGRHSRAERFLRPGRAGASCAPNATMPAPPSLPRSRDTGQECLPKQAVCRSTLRVAGAATQWRYRQGAGRCTVSPIDRFGAVFVRARCAAPLRLALHRPLQDMLASPVPSEDPHRRASQRVPSGPCRRRPSWCPSPVARSCCNNRWTTDPRRPLTTPGRCATSRPRPPVVGTAK